MMAPNILSQLRNYEKISLIYILLTALIALFAQVPTWQDILLQHAVLFLVIIMVAVLLENTSFSALQHLRNWYLFLLFPILFKELTYLHSALFPHYLEAFLISSDSYFFSHHLSFVSTLRQYWLANEIMAFSYWSYYLLLPGIGISLHIARGHHAMLQYIFRVCFAFLACYLIFILIPVRGPHHTLTGLDPTTLEGGFFYQTILFMQSKGSTVGAAFPSSHVAVAWVAIFEVRQLNKTVYHVCAVLMSLLTLSVFYLGYHYVLDAVFGYALALVLLYILNKLDIGRVPINRNPVLNANFNFVAGSDRD